MTDVTSSVSPHFVPIWPMATKRTHSPDLAGAGTSSKRRRLSATLATGCDDLLLAHDAPAQMNAPNFNEQSRLGLQRGILLALNHVGFDTAQTTALESFTQMTETYLSSLIEDVAAVARSARRTQAIPTDYEATLQSFNLTTTSLKPHRKTPISDAMLRVTYDTQCFLDEGEDIHLPCLTDELSGKAQRDARQYIPKFFPDFPSIHTYQSTPVDVDTVTVQAPSDDSDRAGELAAAGVHSQRGVDWRDDPEKIREAAAVQAKQAEDALRGLVRASKMANLKDLRIVAEKDKATRERYGLWETSMHDLLADLGGGDRIEIANHSMSLNSHKGIHRADLPKTTRRHGEAIGSHG